VSDDAGIEIRVDLDNVKKMTSEQKLNVLIDIAFANNRGISRQGRILYGEDGQQGICETVRTTSKAVKWLWGIFCAVATFMSGVLFTHIMKG
jgi:hypothetical protein